MCISYFCSRSKAIVYFLNSHKHIIMEDLQLAEELLYPQCSLLYQTKSLWSLLLSPSLQIKCLAWNVIWLFLNSIKCHHIVLLCVVLFFFCLVVGFFCWFFCFCEWLMVPGGRPGCILVDCARLVAICNWSF